VPLVAFGLLREEDEVIPRWTVSTAPTCEGASAILEWSLLTSWKLQASPMPEWRSSNSSRTGPTQHASIRSRATRLLSTSNGASNRQAPSASTRLQSIIAPLVADHSTLRGWQQGPTRPKALSTKVPSRSRITVIQRSLGMGSLASRRVAVLTVRLGPCHIHRCRMQFLNVAATFDVRWRAWLGDAGTWPE